MKSHTIGLTLATYLLSLLCMVGQVQAEIAVIVNSSNSAEVSQDAVSRIFLGKMKSFPGGAKAAPVNLAETTNTRSRFDNELLGKSPSQMKAYWSSLIFTGRATPIPTVESDAAVINTVKSDPKAIGYVDSGSVDGSVRVLFSF